LPTPAIALVAASYVADIPGPDEFLHRAIGTEQRGAHLRHAGVSGAARHQLVNGSADLLDLNHGEAGEKNEKAQDQRKPPNTPRPDTDPGQHDGQFFIGSRKF